jgi:hypothetical protein
MGTTKSKLYGLVRSPSGDLAAARGASFAAEVLARRYKAHYGVDMAVLTEREHSLIEHAIYEALVTIADQRGNQDASVSELRADGA